MLCFYSYHVLLTETEMWFCRYHFYKTQGKQKYMDLEAFLQVNVIDQISKMYAVSFSVREGEQKRDPTFTNSEWRQQGCDGPCGTWTRYF